MLYQTATEILEPVTVSHAEADMAAMFDNAQLATMSSQARWRYQARSHLEHIFW